jgi:hypothetical protein
VKKSVAQLAGMVQREREASQSDTANLAATAAKTEVLRLLADYSQLQENQRATDQQNLAVTLRSFETRLGRLRAELETVARRTDSNKPMRTWRVWFRFQLRPGNSNLKPPSTKHKHEKSHGSHQLRGLDGRGYQLEFRRAAKTGGAGAGGPGDRTIGPRGNSTFGRRG